MEIELLYFDGCPNHELAETRLKQALQLEGLDFKFQKINIETLEMAERFGFCGSPTIRINCKYLENRTDVNYSCRIYQNEKGTEGAPSVELIRKRLKAETNNKINYA